MTNREHRAEGITPEDGELLRALGSTPVRPASAESRERARAAFLTGAIPGKTVPIGGRSRRPALRSYVPLALAAGLLALVIVGLQPSERWTVLEVTGAAGTAMPGAAPARGATFASGRVTTAAGSVVDVQLGAHLRVQVAPGSRVVFPRGPGRWLGKTRDLRLERGEVFGTSEGRPLGFELVLSTPEAEARLLGTTFAVTRNELGPCFCLYEGKLEVRARGHEPLLVPTGMRVQVYDDDRAPRVLDLTDMERTKLRMIREAGLARSAR